MDLSALLLLTAIAGYGDPVEGFPSAEERELVLWTNAARVAPKEFKSEYSAGGCSIADFSADEKKAKAPLYIDLDLTEVARVHSADMHDNGCFQHESCDGTDTWTRVGRYYHDANSGLGENIAYGSSDPKYTVLSMWMCSHDGHRANIMSGSFNEMGGGIDHDYMTQDFAAGELREGDPPVRVAAERGGVIWADWGDDSAPAELSLYVDGNATDMVLKYGDDDNGVYYQSIDGDACTPWWVSWTTKGGESGTFPATGAFLSGGCDDDYDADARPAGSGDGDGDDVGDDVNPGNGAIKVPEVLCSTSPEAGLLAGVLGALAVMRRRGSFGADSRR
ncbi:hypothetical protein LBMAG42_39860 [Deltaproteobacteria bacterium]|nr:hypothetical protein LBMAG42_39860 [Deltaproteobacteria bacterium]